MKMFLKFLDARICWSTFELNQIDFDLRMRNDIMLAVK